MSVPARSVAVIGGGWAGLAAAVEATRAGHHVTLFEMAPQLGGRARRVKVDGFELDNGQHILIGAYTETLGLMRSVGVDIAQAFRRTPLSLVGPDQQGLVLPTGGAASAFVRGVLAQRGWAWHDRLRLLFHASGWMLKGFRCAPMLTVAQLTAAMPRSIRDDLIEPLCVAALNTPSAEASAEVFLRVLRDALFAGPGSADLLLPRVRLSDLLPEPAGRWLIEARARVHLGRRIDRIAPADDGWRVDDMHFSHVVLATPPGEAARLAAAVGDEWAQAAAALRYEPIVTVYLQSADARLPRAMLSLRSDTTQAPAQFVFDLGALGGPTGLLAFVVSGARPWVDRGSEATVEATLRQARATLSASLRGPLQLVKVLTEKRATFRCTPALRRPASRIAANLHAAGDYIAGPYPATLEGAVRSGLAAAKNIV